MRLYRIYEKYGYFVVEFAGVRIGSYYTSVSAADKFIKQHTEMLKFNMEQVAKE